MTARKPATVKGTDVQPGQVFKLGGRWVRLVRWTDDEWSHNLRFALVAPASKDPRLALLSHRPYLKFRAQRFVYGRDEYLTRVQAAPEWEWVTRQIERMGH